MAEKNSSVAMQRLSGKQLGLMFVSFLVIHAAVIYLANRWFPSQVVLGNHFFSPIMALIYSSIAFTLVVTAFVPIAEHIAEAMKTTLTNLHWAVLYMIVNIIGLWSLARVAEWLGMGLQSWVAVVALAAVITFLQGMAVKPIMDMKD